MLALLLRVPLRTWLLIGAVLALLGAGLWALDSYGDRREDEGRAAVQAEWNAQREVMEQAADKAEAEYRLLEDAFTAKKQEAQRARETQRAAARAAADAFRADERVRDEGLAAYAAGGGAAAEDPGPACRDRASRLSAALGEALSAHRACVGDLVDAAADTRLLLEAWPVNPAASAASSP